LEGETCNKEKMGDRMKNGEMEEIMEDTGKEVKKEEWERREERRGGYRERRDKENRGTRGERKTKDNVEEEEIGEDCDIKEDSYEGDENFDDEQENGRRGNRKRKALRSPVEYETDEAVLERREKQISYGKNTVDYDKYLQLVDKQMRGKKMPRTPQKMRKYSRRQWDGLVKKWKQDVHKTVAVLEGQDEDDDYETRPDSSNSQVSSWADEVEEEDRRRRRASGDSTLTDDQESSYSDEETLSQEGSPKKILKLEDV